MLLVDDDQAELRQRREDGRCACRRRRRRRRGGCAATGRGARRPRGRCAGWRRARRTPRGRSRPRRASARSPGPASARRGPLADRAREPQVDLGLAAAGHAVEQRDVISAVRRAAPTARRAPRLLRGQSATGARVMRRAAARTDRARRGAARSRRARASPGGRAIARGCPRPRARAAACRRARAQQIERLHAAAARARGVARIARGPAPSAPPRAPSATRRRVPFSGGVSVIRPSASRPRATAGAPCFFVSASTRDRRVRPSALEHVAPRAALGEQPRLAGLGDRRVPLALDPRARRHRRRDRLADAAGVVVGHPGVPGPRRPAAGTRRVQDVDDGLDVTGSRVAAIRSEATSRSGPGPTCGSTAV